MLEAEVGEGSAVFPEAGIVGNGVIPAEAAVGRFAMGVWLTPASGVLVTARALAAEVGMGKPDVAMAVCVPAISMAFIPEVDTGFGKFAFGVAVAPGADDAERVQALTKKVKMIKINNRFLLLMEYFSPPKWRLIGIFTQFV